MPDDLAIRGRLFDASQGNFDVSSDTEPIRALLDHLEADVVPVVARMLPDLPRPLKNCTLPLIILHR